MGPGFLRRHLPGGKSRPPHKVVLYGKEGCHLCADVKAMLDSLKEDRNFTVREVDITSDDALFEQYEFLIPVVQIDGERELCAPVRLADLRRALS